MSRLLVAVSAAVTLAAGALYLRTALEETRPQIVSWLGWTGLLVTGAVASLDTGQVPAAAYTLSCAAMCAAVVVLIIRFRAPSWSLGLLNWACLAGVGAGLALLLAVHSPAWATGLTVAVDAAAYVPTAVHAWQYPREEPWLAFAGWSAGAALTLAAGSLTVFTEVAYPAYLLAADTAVTAVILARRGIVRPARIASRPGGSGPAPGC